MSGLILNSFPVEIIPSRFTLPFVQFDTWEASSAAKGKAYSEFETYRYEHEPEDESNNASSRHIYLLLLSGPQPPPETKLVEIDISHFSKLGSVLIENSLSDYLKSKGMTIRKGHFEQLALRRVDNQPSSLVHLYSGISFVARRPFRSRPQSFMLSVQWVSSAVFAETLANPDLRDISKGLGVLYTPQANPSADVVQFQNRFLGYVRSILSSDEAEVNCRDNVCRAIPLGDLTLEASSEALRGYETTTGSQSHSPRIWKRLQQLSKVLTSEGRRNPSVLRERLDAIRGVLGGLSKEQLVLPLKCYAEAAVSIGLEPIRVELP